jgi:predicted nuclease of restriction endonuclease-like RecB superfamily
LAVAISLDADGVKYEYEPRRFRLSDRTYVPDFFLPDQGVYWEVKGWMHERHVETIRRFREESGFPLVVIGMGAIKGFVVKSGVKCRGINGHRQEYERAA